jgi:hypothetical protein
MEERCMMVEVLERAFESYEREKQVEAEKELEKYRKIIEHKPKPKKLQPKLSPYSYLNFTCDNCGDEYEQDTAYSHAPSSDEINNYHTYCSNCVVDE